MFEREWGFYLDDMILFSEKVLAYTEGLDQDSFEADDKAYDATLRKLELIEKRLLIFLRLFVEHVYQYPGVRLLQPGTGLFMAIWE